MDLSDRSVSELFRAGYRLRLPCEATAVSVKLFHEFAGDSDITLLPVDELNLAITTCLFLAAKLEVSSDRRFCRRCCRCSPTAAGRPEFCH